MGEYIIDKEVKEIIDECRTLLTRLEIEHMPDNNPLEFKMNHLRASVRAQKLIINCAKLLDIHHKLMVGEMMLEQEAE